MADRYMPRSIPNPANDSMAWAPNSDNVLRSPFDISEKTRPISTQDNEKLTCSLYLETVELDILLDFYKITCRQVLPFFWWDLRWPSLTDRYATYTWLARPSYNKWYDAYKCDISLKVLRTYKGNFLLDFYDAQVWPTT